MDAPRRSRSGSLGRRLAAAALAALAASLCLIACGDGDGTGTGGGTTSADAGLRVVVEPARAEAGATVRARVVNDTDREFTYGAAYELERQVGDSFEPVKLPPRPVPEIGYVAKPGASGPAVDVEIPKDALPGQYRVVIQRDVPDVGDLTGDFAVGSDY
jgi:hypothetical protein